MLGMQRIALYSLVSGLIVFSVVSSLYIYSHRRTFSDNSPLDIPREIDFGLIEPGNSKKQVKITNHSASEINLLDFRSNCGCTVADLRLPCKLQPGQDVLFNISLDAPLSSGPLQKQVIIKTDIAERHDFLISILANVKGTLKPTVLPSLLDFGSFGSWEKKHRDFQLVYRGSAQLRPVVQTQLPRDMSLECTSAQAGELFYRLSMRHALPEGLLPNKIMLETSFGEVELQIKGRKFGDFYPEEGVVVVRYSDPIDIRGTITIIHRPNFPLHDLTIVSPEGAVRLLSVTRETSHRAKLLLNFILPDKVSAAKGEFGVCSANNPDTTIPVRFVVASAE
jgi:hypothetical protein